MLELTVSDVKQYLYCPRIIFHRYVAKVNPVPTVKMEIGKEEHGRTQHLERRRSFKEFDLGSGERLFGIPLHSPRLGLSGNLDMLIKSNKEFIPVEFKDSTKRPSLNHKYQLIAYAMLVEDTYNAVVRKGFIYLIPEKKAVEYLITPNMRRFVKHTLEKIRSVIASDQMPEPTPHRARCRDCEFRRYCNDIW